MRAWATAASIVDWLMPAEVKDRPLAMSRHLLRPISSQVANVHLFMLIVDVVVGKV